VTDESERLSVVDILLIPKVFFIDGVAWGAWAGFMNTWEWFTDQKPLPIQFIIGALIMSLASSFVGACRGVVLGVCLLTYYLAGERVRVW